VPVERPAPPARLALIWRPAPGPALRELIAYCGRAFTTARNGTVPSAPRKETP